MQVYDIKSLKNKTKLDIRMCDMWEEKLHAIKMEITRLTDITRWNSDTRRYEFTYWVKKFVKQDKYRCPGDASNAYFKLWELMGFIKPKGRIHHFDNASFPGDFVRSLNMYASKISSSYRWRANSLQSDRKNVLGDKFGLLKMYPQNWVMSDDQDGDVTNLANIEKIVKLVGDKKINIYTSDLGFPFQNRFKEEEEHLAANIGQIYLGLRILQPGGTLITKQFSIFRDRSQNMISYVSTLFDKFWIIKPRMSKTDNSEIYLVGVGYRGGVEPKYFEYTEQFPDSNRSFTPVIEGLVSKQVAKIKENLRIFETNSRYKKPSDAEIQSWLMDIGLDVE